MLDTIYIIGAQYVIYLTIAVAGLYFFFLPKEDKKHFVILAVIALPLAYIMAKVAGHFYFDPRPFVDGHFTPLISHAADNGFPSDHALLASAIAAVLYPFRKAGSIILWLLAIVIGISRVYVGVHHPIDIIGSILISVVATGIVYFSIKKYTNIHI
jgi:undecaprenyl-diphosphatase